MTKYVWWIEGGDYSDYRVDGVYSTRKRAVKMLDLYRKNKYREMRVVRVALDVFSDFAEAGLCPFCVQMGLDGNNAQVKMMRPCYITNQGYFLRDLEGKPNGFYTTVWASDETHAIKITNERRTKMIAKREMK